MKTLVTILNLATAGVGLFLVSCLLYTYDNPIPLGCLFILLLCAKCCVEVLQK